MRVCLGRMEHDECEPDRRAVGRVVQVLPIRLRLGFSVQGSGFSVQGSGFRVQGLGLRVQGSGSGVIGPVRLARSRSCSAGIANTPAICC